MSFSEHLSFLLAVDWGHYYMGNWTMDSKWQRELYKKEIAAIRNWTTDNENPITYSSYNIN